MDLRSITPLLLTYNEETNIAAAISSLIWAERIVVLDSNSTDATLEIAALYKNVTSVHRAFDNHTSQWNFGLDQVESEWVLTLDADYIASEQFRQELETLVPSSDVYCGSFRYCVFGKQLRGSLYPNRAILFRTEKFRYQPDGHTQLLDTQSVAPGLLKTPLLHDDRKSLGRWCVSQFKYATLEAEKLVTRPLHTLGWKDRIRRNILWAPLLVLFYCLVVKGLLLDGRAGIYYSLQRVYAELTLSLVLLDSAMRTRTDESSTAINSSTKTKGRPVTEFENESGEVTRGRQE